MTQGMYGHGRSPSSNSRHRTPEPSTIQHTVHGFSGILNVEDPPTSVGPSVPGDFDGDGVVGQPDFVLFADHFGNTPDDETWDPKYGLDLSGRVDFLDLFIFANNFGKES